MPDSRKLLDHYLPPGDGFVLESFVATTYQVDFEFLEEDLLSVALGIRAPSSRMRAFRSEMERRLQTTDVSVLYDPRGCPRLARLSPRIDPIPVMNRKLHAKLTLLMWVRTALVTQEEPQRRVRLIVGSANLTRQGFRENYECAVAMDYGGGDKAPSALLLQAIALIGRIGAQSPSPQLSRQLAAFQSYAARLPDGPSKSDDPIALVTAEDTVPQLSAAFKEISATGSTAMTIVSPFWPEGATAVDAMVELTARLGPAERVDLVCRSALAPDGRSWLPEFDAELAAQLRGRIDARLFLRPALPHIASGAPEQLPDDAGDETEDDELARRIAPHQMAPGHSQRALHAKLILVDGQHGSVLYAGSSNCTRRGMGLGGPSNWEAGLIYRLSRKHRRQIGDLLGMAADPIEVLPGQKPRTVAPTREPDLPVPSFLEEIVAYPSLVTIRFRSAVEVPDDLVILMPIPTTAGDAGYRILYRSGVSKPEAGEAKVDLRSCSRCNENLEPVPDAPVEGAIPLHVYVEVRWDGKVAQFPVRFDDKATLPLLLVGRRPTEGELIEYFLFGHEPDPGGEPHDTSGKGSLAPDPDGPIDTRRILAYFMRRFVQAIPGIEAEIARAAYSRTALDAALRGPTGVLELAERAFLSLTKNPGPDEPIKTPTAIGFQLVEITAALGRCREKLVDKELQACFEPALNRCRELLNQLVANNPQLGDRAFQAYSRQFLGGAN